MSRQPSGDSPAITRARLRQFARRNRSTDALTATDSDSDTSFLPPGDLSEEDDSAGNFYADEESSYSMYPLSTDQGETPPLPNDSLEGDGSTPELDLEETFHDAPISRVPSPYPSPPEFSDSDPDADELLPITTSPSLISPSFNAAASQPSPRLGSLSRSPSGTSIATSSSDDSDYYAPTNAQLFITKMSNTNGFASITGVNRAKDCPILAEGVITPEIMLAWARACRRYRDMNTLTEELLVAHVGGSVKEPHLQDWFAAE